MKLGAVLRSGPGRELSLSLLPRFGSHVLVRLLSHSLSDREICIVIQ